MKNLSRKNSRGFMYSIPALSVLLIVVSISCEKQGSSSSNPGLKYSSEQKTLPVNVASLTMSRQQALSRINALFKDELQLIRPEQVQGINKQQFIQWLRSSKIAAAEQQYLQPLLSSNVTEVVLLHGVKYLQTGKQATIALVAVPQPLQGRYTKLIVLTDLDEVILGRLCSWFQCDYLDPSMCLCLYKVSLVSGNTNCPSDECHPSYSPCTAQNGRECTDPNMFEVISAF